MWSESRRRSLSPSSTSPGVEQLIPHAFDRGAGPIRAARRFFLSPTNDKTGSKSGDIRFGSMPGCWEPHEDLFEGEPQLWLGKRGLCSRVCGMRKMFACLVVAVVLAGCGDDSPDKPDANEPTTSTDTGEPTTSTDTGD